MPKSDGEFIKQAATFGQTAIALCDLAATRGLGAAVQRLASDLKTDHEAVAVELNALAKTKHVDLPTHAKASDTKPAEAISMLSGAEFDREFLDRMQMDLRTAIALFEFGAGRDDPGVKTFATKTIPILKDQVQRIEDLQKTMVVDRP